MPLDIEKIMQMDAEAAERERLAAQDEGKIVKIPIDKLTDFPAERQHFRLATGQRLLDLQDSIRKLGILNPILVRRLDNDQYQILAGRNRRTAAQNIGYREVDCIVKNPRDEDEALGIVITDNLQNRELLPSERGWSYRELMEMRTRQGYRTDLTSRQIGTKLRSDESIAMDAPDSARQIQRYIRLTYLIKPLLELVDEKQMGIGTGVELSYLKQRSQQTVYSYCYAGSEPHPLKEAQARALREIEADPDRIIDEETLEELLAPKKVTRFRTLKLKMADLRKYFPTGTPEEVVKQTIHTALAAYFDREEE